MYRVGFVQNVSSIRNVVLTDQRLNVTVFVGKLIVCFILPNVLHLFKKFLKF